MFSDTSYGAPAEINDMNGTQTHVEDSKRRKQYYDEQFRPKDSISGTVRERVQRDSPVVAELRTNVIVCLPSPHIQRVTDRNRLKTNSA